MASSTSVYGSRQQPQSAAATDDDEDDFMNDPESDNLCSQLVIDSKLLNQMAPNSMKPPLLPHSSPNENKRPISNPSNQLCKAVSKLDFSNGISEVDTLRGKMLSLEKEVNNYKNLYNESQRQRKEKELQKNEEIASLKRKLAAAKEEIDLKEHQLMTHSRINALKAEAEKVVEETRVADLPPEENMDIELLDDSSAETSTKRCKTEHFPSSADSSDAIIPPTQISEQNTAVEHEKPIEPMVEDLCLNVKKALLSKEPLEPSVNESMNTIFNDIVKIVPLFACDPLSTKTCGHFNYESENYVRQRKELEQLTRNVVQDVQFAKLMETTKITSCIELAQRHILNYISFLIRAAELEKKTLKIPVAKIAELREARSLYFWWRDPEAIPLKAVSNITNHFSNPWIHLQEVSILKCNCIDVYHGHAIASIELLKSFCRCSTNYVKQINEFGVSKHSPSQVARQMRNRARIKLLEKLENSQNEAVGSQTPKVPVKTNAPKQLSTSVNPSKDSSSNSESKRREAEQRHEIVNLLFVLATTTILPENYSFESIKVSLELLHSLSVDKNIDLRRLKDMVTPQSIIDLLYYSVELEIPSLLLKIMCQLKDNSIFRVLFLNCFDNPKDEKRSVLTGISASFHKISEACYRDELTSVHYSTVFAAITLFTGIIDKHADGGIMSFHDVDCICWSKFCYSFTAMLNIFVHNPTVTNSAEGKRLLQEASALMSAFKQWMTTKYSEIFCNVQCFLRRYEEMNAENNSLVFKMMSNSDV